MSSAQDQIGFSHKLLSWTLIILLAGQPVLPAFAAGITPQGNTQLDKAGNGVPVVNIATPNQAGISHNTYKDYNVGPEGLILNNATGQLNQSQLGGLIQNNPNLKAGREAQAIINEVNGGNRSQLQGYTEVAGKAANVMVANPYGITCNGCGFINTPNATLTTGKPVFDANGNMLALDVTKGSILIEGKGLDASQSDGVSIISRAAEINARLHAKDVNVVVGANRVGSDGSINAIAGDGPAPKVAVDTGALGGMYANRIRLVSGESGVGVNLGNLNARQGDITLDVNGKLALNNSLASGSLNANGAGVTLTGDHKAGGNIAVASRGDIELTGSTLTSDNALQLSADGQIRQRGGKLTVGRDMTLTAKSLSQQDNAVGSAAGNITLNAHDSAITQGFNAGQQLSFSGGTLNNQGQLTASGAAQVTGHHITNNGLIQGESLFLSAADLLNSGQLNGGRSLDITAQNLYQQGDIGTKGNARINVSGVMMNSGRTLADGALMLNADDLQQHGTLSGKTGLSVAAQRLTSGTASLTHSDGALHLNSSQRAILDGEVSAGGDLTLNTASLSTLAGAQIQSDRNLLLNAARADLSGTLAAKGSLNIQASEILNHRGNTSAGMLNIDAPTLNNSGTLYSDGKITLGSLHLLNGGAISAATLVVNSPQITNRGLLQGSHSLTLLATLLDNQQHALIYSARNLALTLPALTNSGVITSDAALEISGASLTNQGEISAASLSLNHNTLTNLAQGQLLAQGANLIISKQFTNAGAVAGDALTVQTDTLTSSGLFQGNRALSFSGDRFSFADASRTLTAGTLDFSTNTLTSDGLMQGQNVNVSAGNWRHGGSLLGTRSLTASVSGELINSGDVLSQGDIALRSGLFSNAGSVLGAGDLWLEGETFMNGGSVQGQTLALQQGRINNQGSLIGLTALTLSARTALDNGAQSSILTGGDLRINAGDITQDGTWQGQRVLLSASSLDNGGAIQSADALELNVANTLSSRAGSKITANGSAALSALALANNGQWIAANLTLTAGSLNNSGDITGINALSAMLNQTLSQQPGGKMLSAGVLSLNTGQIDNAGQIQGDVTQLTANSLRNAGRIQGKSSLEVQLIGDLTNSASGVLLSENAFTLAAANLFNEGVMQGNAGTTFSLGQQADNRGKLLSEGAFSLTAAQFTNTGWWQASTLNLNAASAANSGTWLATNSAILRGGNLRNTATIQGANLTVNDGSLFNSGTLLGNQSLTINADSVEQQAGAALFSGGDLLLSAARFSGGGQVVALGNAALNLIDAFMLSGTLAAGERLTVTSQRAIDNRGVLQGQGVTLSAGEQLTNNGQIVTGSADSAFSGGTVALNDSGSLQAGGDVSIISQSDVTVAGFTGAAGSLTVNAAGMLLNTALLYAGNNLNLFADSIHNIYGTLLAGDSLWMQRDAQGAANTLIINRSGTIETTRGDITLNTAHLLNEADGLTITQYQQDYPDAIPEKPGYSGGLRQPPDLWIEITDWKKYADNLFWKNDPQCHGANDVCIDNYTHRIKGEDTLQFLLSESVVSVTASGNAARIASGRDIAINAGTLDNRASHILAQRNVTLTGDTLNNLSAQGGRQFTYVQAEYRCEWFYSDCNNSQWNSVPEYSETYWDWPGKFRLKGMTLPYLLGERTTGFEADGGIYRSVINAGGNVVANFTHDISNTNVTANAGGIGGAITAPTLNTLSHQTIASGVAQDVMGDAQTLGINSPQWRDALNDAIQTINGGGGLENQQGKGADTSAYPLPSGNNGYFVTSTDPDSPYLITVNPKLDGLGQLDPSLFGDLYALLGIQPGDAPRETNTAWTDKNQFLGSSYFLERLGLSPDRDYRFLGDAAFDTRYVSNVILNQTGSRYINGIGSDLEQMRYLMDSAANQQQALGLKFGVALTADQIAALDSSILWWEAATINGQTVMVPKVYLSPKDVTLQQGSVISGNNVMLAAADVTNNGGTLSAQQGLTIDSSNTISNLNAGLITAGGDLQLSALGDINNIGSTISGKTVGLESVGGSINNITRAQQWNIDTRSTSLSGTDTGDAAAIRASDSLTLSAGQDINVTGASVSAGTDLAMKAGGDINVTANQTQEQQSRSGFRGKNATDNGSVTHAGSTISAGGNLTMQAGNDLSLTASEVSAGANATLSAGNDLHLNAAENRTHSVNGKKESHASGADRSIVSAGGDLALVAGRDLTSQAAGMAAEGNVTLQAGRDVSLLAEAQTEGDSYRSKNKTVINESVRQQGTEIASGGDTKIIAGRDVNAQAAQVTAQGDIGVAAGRDVNLTTATESDYSYREEKKTKSGFLSKKTTHTIQEDSATREAGTLLSGDNVTVSAGNNLLIDGSAVVGDGNIALSAGNNVDIVAATNTDTSWRFKEEKKSGLMGTGGIGFTLGSSKTTQDRREAGTTQSQSASTVGSTGGNVSITAGNQAHISGSDVIANRDISITGDSVVIDPGHDRRTVDETFEQKKSGLTVALSGTVGSAINNAVTNAQETKETSDSRLRALQATKTALSGVQAGQAAAVASATGDPNAMGVSLSLTTQKSKSQQHSESDTVSGSTLNAGNNLSIISTGKNKGVNSGDVVIAGSQLKAGSNTTLDAANDILLLGAANTQKTTGKNSSSGGGVGVSIGAGGSGAGISIFANVNASKGNEKGNGTEWTETTIDSGKTITINSGRDTVLNGAQVSGDKITADVGRDLLMSSQQDNNDYDSKQNSVAAGGSFTFGSMTGSGYISASQDKMKSRYDSVQEQTGMFAGDGGFDITVGKHTQLDGAVIASTATADKNHLDTGTLGFSDIHNEADYKVSHSGISLSGGGSFGGDQFKGNMPGGMISAGGNSGHAEGTTQAAVAEGSITIRDQANQKQDIADLSRDPEHANDSISPIFDKEKEQKRLQEVGLISDIGSQAADILRTHGELNALEVAKKTHGDLPANATEQQREEWLAKLKNTPEYRAEMEFYGTGSDLQRGIQAVTAALQGLAGGDMTGALAGGAAPYLAEAIGHKAGLSDGSKVIAHAIAGAVIAAAQGQNAGAGAAGASIGELAGMIALELYGKPVGELKEEQKQTISTLATLAAGLAGGLAGDSTAGAATGAQAGKNAVENNTLGNKNDKLPPIIPINPLNPGVVDENGDPLKGGGGIAKYTINKGQQNKHIEGTNEYKTAAASSGSQRSILTVDPQSLLPQLGTGQQVGKVDVGLAGSKERIDFGKPIGNFVDRDTGLSVPTTKGIVHYGKDGAHIVPARP